MTCIFAGYIADFTKDLVCYPMLSVAGNYDIFLYQGERQRALCGQNQIRRELPTNEDNRRVCCVSDDTCVGLVSECQLNEDEVCHLYCTCEHQIGRAHV